MSRLGRERKLHRFSKYPEYLLKALVRIRDAYPALIEQDPTSMPSKWELAQKSGIISSNDLELVYEYRITWSSMIGTPETPEDKERTGILRFVDENLDAAVKEMKERGWLSLVWEGGIWPSSDGVDYGRMLMRHWYVKMWDFFKGDVRTALITVITAVVITIITTLVLRALGWQ